MADQTQGASEPARAEGTAVVDGLWRVDADGAPVLLGGRCGDCTRTHFPVGPLCPWCGAPDVATHPLPRTGTLWGWTAVATAPPGYEGPVPFGFGVVELDDGLRVVTRLTEPDPATLAFGQPMALVLDGVGPDGGDPQAWAFAPVDRSAPR